MIFSVEQVRQIRQGKRNAALFIRETRVTPGRVVPLRRLVPTHDEDGNVTAVSRETVTDPQPNGDSRPVHLTILNALQVWVADLDHQAAAMCGHKTRDGLIAEWRGVYPRRDSALLVTFAVGDLRDRDRYISFTGRGGGDYTANPHRSSAPEAPALSREELDRVAAISGQSYAKREAELAAKLAAQPLAKRIARLENVQERDLTMIKRELQVLTDRAARFEKRTSSDD